MTEAVSGLDLKVPPDCTFGFLGPNGAGKTTTIKMLLGLVRPTRGGGRVLDRPLGNQEVRKRIGFLPEEPAFSRHLKAREFLTLCAKLSHVEPDEQKKRVGEALETVKLSHRAGSRLSEFSRGMLQRIGIAQALLHDPTLLILDEPMTGLDPPGRREIKEIMQNLRQREKTIFFSSHILSDVEELCDSIGILNQGRLVLSGPILDLLGTAGVEYTVTNMPATLLPTIEPLVAGMQKRNDQWILQVAEKPNQEKVRRILSDGGCSDIESHRLQKNLDDVFMETIEADNERRGKETQHG
ncbi:MAG: ABC transporter ATP-binding protein [Phycisphaerae bacterium]|nr:ABC transporter ATP-binding protein [Phycisphaerae bacterium]